MEKQNNNTEKITDKAFSRLIVTSIFGILVCLICLCSSTYAWFTSSVSSGSNKIKSASAEQCQLTVTVSEIDENGKVVKELLKADLATAEEQRKLQLTHDTTYLVELSLPKDSASGYLMMTSGEKNYYSPYICWYEEGTVTPISFTLKVESDTSVTFTPRWGIYSDSTLCSVQDGKITIPTTTTDVEESTTG